MNRTLGVLISGRGSNLQALIDAQQHDRLGGEIVAVVPADTTTEQELGAFMTGSTRQSA